MLFSFLYFVLLCPFAVPPTNQPTHHPLCAMLLCSRWIGAREETSIDDMIWSDLIGLTHSYHPCITMQTLLRKWRIQCIQSMLQSPCIRLIRCHTPYLSPSPSLSSCGRCISICFVVDRTNIGRFSGMLCIVGSYKMPSIPSHGMFIVLVFERILLFMCCVVAW